MFDWNASNNNAKPKSNKKFLKLWAFLLSPVPIPMPNIDLNKDGIRQCTYIKLPSIFYNNRKIFYKKKL